jgi:hypothetical protein
MDTQVLRLQSCMRRNEPGGGQWPAACIAEQYRVGRVRLVGKRAVGYMYSVIVYVHKRIPLMPAFVRVYSGGGRVDDEVTEAAQQSAALAQQQTAMQRLLPFPLTGRAV